MRLKNDRRFTKESYADLGIELYRASTEIYDELIYKNEKYYLLHRCGVEPFHIDHNHTVYHTDMTTLVYALDEKNYWEEELDGNILKSYWNETSFNVTGGEFISSDIEIDVDHRYESNYEHCIGRELNIEDDGDTGTSKSYVMSISNIGNYEIPQTCATPISFPRSFSFNGITEIGSDGFFHSLGEKSDNGYSINFTNTFDYDHSHDGYWKCYQYEECNPTLDAIKDLEPVDKYLYNINDFNTVNMGRKLKNAYTMYMYTYVYNKGDTVYNTRHYFKSVGVSKSSSYVNGTLVSSNINQWSNYYNLSPGWNLIEVLYEIAKNTPVHGLTITEGYLLSYCNYLNGKTQTEPTISRLSYSVKEFVGDTLGKIDISAPMRKVNSVVDVFTRINPLNPSLTLNSTSLVKSWKYAVQRNIGALKLTVENINNFESQEITVDNKKYNQYSYTLDDIKRSTSNIISDKIDNITVNNKIVSFTISEDLSLSDFVGTTILYEKEEPTFELIKNQQEFHNYIKNNYYGSYYYSDYTECPDRKIYLVEAPKEEVTFTQQLGAYDFYQSPIMPTVPDDFYLSQMYYNTDNGMSYKDNEVRIVVTYDKNLNEIAWTPWDEFVNILTTDNSEGYNAGFYKCPEGVYGIRYISSLTNENAYNQRLYYNGAENIFDTSAWWENISEKNTDYFTLADNVFSAKNTGGTEVVTNTSSYNITVKSNVQYILLWDCNETLCGSIKVKGITDENNDAKTDDLIAESELGKENKKNFLFFSTDKYAEATIQFSVNANSQYSLSNIRCYELEKTELETIEYKINDGETKTLNLPFVLNDGQELVYYPERHLWQLVDLTSDSNCDFLKYTDEDIVPIELKKGDTISFVQKNIIGSTAFDYIVKRQIDTPNVTFLCDGYKNGNFGYGYVQWNSVVGATEYQIVYNDTDIIATFDAEYDYKYRYDFKSELKGYIEIVALNDLGVIARSKKYEIQTVPATIEIDDFDSIYENNRYNITVKFQKSSKTADEYLLFYSIDGGSQNLIRYKNDGSGEYVEEVISVVSVNDNISFQLVPTNESGDNDYEDSIELKPCEGFDVWTYKEGSKQLLTTFYDKFDDEDYYNIKYRINSGDWNVLQVDGSKKESERLVEYIGLQPTQTMDLCLAPVRQGYTNLYSPPITVSKALDTTLLAPKQFAGTKLSDGKIQFTWLDDYWIDSAFELYYTYSDGTSDTIKIDQDMDYGSYVYSTGNYGFINARVRMVWEFGESAYTDFIIVYNIPEVKKAPEIEGRYRDIDDINKVRVTWQQYDFVKNYIVYFIVDGTQTTTEVPDNEYLWSIPDDGNPHAITCRVQAKFVDDSITDISESVSFNVVQYSGRQQTVVYATTDVEYPEYTIVYTQGLEIPYDLYMYSLNNYDWEYPIYMKRYEPDLEQTYDLYADFWGHNIGPEYLFKYDIVSKYVKNFRIEQIQYSNITNEDLMQTMIYRNTSSEYRIMSEFVKMVICCLGDSITAGHPNYWAETGTGLINSQYEYWLSRRLKDEYDVINKGYGQEKTQDMVDRFERDVLPTNADYCIFLGGTNDWYQDASTKDLATGYIVMDRAITNVKTIIQKCWDNGIYPIIGTLTPRNDITEDGKKLFDYFNDWVKNYTTEQSIQGKDCAYVDFFNAGKDFDPPEPLEDPDKSYHLNPLFDGDNVYDENGNMIRSGLGVHMNPDGYRVMGYAIPLALFKTADSGMKLYRDSACTKEETYNTEEASHPYYEIDVNNVRRGEEKKVIKYIKNIGVNTTLYYIYLTTPHNIKYYFLDSQGNKKEFLTGVCNPGLSKQLTLVVESGFDDFTSTFELHILTRDLSS